MKTRKIFLDGYIELSRELFKAEKVCKPFVVVDDERGYIGISTGSLALASVEAKISEVVKARIGIHKDNDKFIIVFDEEGEFKAKRYNVGMLRFNNISVARKLAKCGFCVGKHYKATSPEENVLVVTKEEMQRVK
jgi:hypothetical protein